MGKVFAVFFIALVLTGCSTVNSEVSVFHTAAVEKPNSFYIEPAPVLQGSLEAQTYAGLIAEQLEAKGWTRASKQEAQLDVLFAYAIDDGTSETHARPIFGQTGVSGAHTTGTVYGTGNFATFSGNTTYTPTYGVVGAVPVTVTVYQREFRLNMYDRSGAVVYESRVSSSGEGGTIDTVAKCLIDALFADFPGKSGAHRSISVDGNKCKIS
ncbi:MAG TPA: DUF4136 domain-containing protein [Devosia sp.]|nr:DUF4136 domain-containing protein [Devosia sp.]